MRLSCELDRWEWWRDLLDRRWRKMNGDLRGRLLLATDEEIRKLQ